MERAYMFVGGPFHALLLWTYPPRKTHFSTSVATGWWGEG